MKKILRTFLTLLIVASIILSASCAAALFLGDGVSAGELGRFSISSIKRTFESLISHKPKIDLSEIPDLDTDSWELVLVNGKNPVPSGFCPSLGVTNDGYEFDSRAIEALDKMLSDGRSQGMQLVLTSAYRSNSYQSELYENKVWRVMEERGLDYDAAADIAATEVARPSTSEHELGLAADIVCEYYNILDAGYSDTAEAVWLRENCASYGFILRYEADKQDLTGVVYEPWHFRYVGVEAAEYIMAAGICLEEFLDLYK